MSLSNKISLTSNIVEVGNVNISMTYSITPGSYDVMSATLPNTSFLATLPLTSSISGTVSTNVLLTGSTNSQVWALTTIDSSQTTYISTATLSVIYPYFFGTSTIATSSTSGLNSIIPNLSKSISTQQNLITPLSGTNVCIYFAYNGSYFDLSSILDQNGNNVISNFTKSLVNIGSPNGYWEYTPYKVYIYTGGGSIPITTNVSTFTVYYQFNVG